MRRLRQVTDDDFHQAPNSPTIDAGSVDELVSNTDFEGELRPQGAGVAIGADEFDPPPDTTIEDAPAELTNETEAWFSYAGDPADDAASFECSLDWEDFSECSESGTGYTELADGEHVFRVRAVDAKGQVDPTPAEHVWVVDTQGPTIEIARQLALKRKRLVLKFSCVDDALPCSGRLRLRTAAKVAYRGKRGKLPIGSGAFIDANNPELTWRIPLTRQKLLRKKKVKLR